MTIRVIIIIIARVMVYIFAQCHFVATSSVLVVRLRVQPDDVWGWSHLGGFAREQGFLHLFYLTRKTVRKMKTHIHIHTHTRGNVIISQYEYRFFLE